MKNRFYQYIEKEGAGYKTRKVEIESEDTFEGEIEMLAFHISELNNIDKILSLFNFKTEATYFNEQCKSVISVPESHINAQGEGSFSFQSYFLNFPESLTTVNPDAIIVVAMEPTSLGENRDYKMVGYVQAIVIDIKDHTDKEHQGFYYNMLRISDRVENGINVYRRKKLFTLMFSALHSLSGVYGAHFAYAAMGKQNQAITDALVNNSTKYNKHFETFNIHTYTWLNKLKGSKSAAKKLVDISTDVPILKQMFEKMQAHRGHYLFNTINTFEKFLELIKSIQVYSKSSKVFMIPNANGDVEAACIALNWGDYLTFTLKNPKGFYKFIASLKITDNLLYPLHIVGSEEGAKSLLQGIASYYRKNHNVNISVINSYQGDKLMNAKKFFLKDDYLFFIITDDIPVYEAMKKKAEGHIFLEQPIL